MVQRLLQAASKPYFSMLELWLCQGLLNDPFAEFMVEENTVSQYLPSLLVPNDTACIPESWTCLQDVLCTPGWQKVSRLDEGKFRTLALLLFIECSNQEAV